MSRQAATLVLGMLPLALLAACTSARAHLYTLEETPRETAVAIGERPTVVLGPISLPEMVDRPQLAVREGAYGVTVHEQERWAAPLKESLPRLLARFVLSSSASAVAKASLARWEFGWRSRRWRS